jgi:hypothetical protein
LAKGLSLFDLISINENDASPAKLKTIPTKQIKYVHRHNNDINNSDWNQQKKVKEKNKQKNPFRN